MEELPSALGPKLAKARSGESSRAQGRRRRRGREGKVRRLPSPPADLKTLRRGGTGRTIGFPKIFCAHRFRGLHVSSQLRVYRPRISHTRRATGVETAPAAQRICRAVPRPVAGRLTAGQATSSQSYCSAVPSHRLQAASSSASVPLSRRETLALDLSDNPTVHLARPSDSKCAEHPAPASGKTPAARPIRRGRAGRPRAASTFSGCSTAISSPGAGGFPKSFTGLTKKGGTCQGPPAGAAEPYQLRGLLSGI